MESGFVLSKTMSARILISVGSDILCWSRDMKADQSLSVRTKYLFGADGGRSPVARSTKAEFDSAPSQGVGTNVFFKADLSNQMDQRHGQLHWVMNADAKSLLGPASCVRAVRPWRDWLFISFTPGDKDPYGHFKANDPKLNAAIREALGLDEQELTRDIPVTVTRTDSWVVRETVAKNYQPDETAFLLGDAAHRHPPAYGLGSNTCIQDAYNLGWKVAYVAKGFAGPGLLQSYSSERQPVGAKLVRESNEALLGHLATWDALGFLSPDPEKNARDQADLTQPGEAGDAQRKKLHDGFHLKGGEGRSFGLCGNQWYSSAAVFLDDEPAPRPELEGDAMEEFQVSTYPGTRLPHAWLDRPVRRNPISTHDLAGKGAFTLFTGYGGDAWEVAAAKISKNTGIPINTYKIGFGLQWQDIYREWYGRRGVHDSGAVLVRPDRFVAWRSVKVVDDCEGKLSQVLNKVLSRGQEQTVVTGR